MRRLSAKVRKLKLRNGQDALVASFAGFINSSTVRQFEKALSKLGQAGPSSVALDMYTVEYINSSGAAALVRFNEVVRGKGGKLVLLRVPQPVGHVMRLLGVTEIVPFFAEEKAALEYLSSSKTPSGPAPAAKFAQKPPKKIVPVLPKRTSAEASKASVLVVAPKKSFFTDILQMRFAKVHKGSFKFVTDCVQAWLALDEMKPDLIILEDTVAGSEDFLSKLKSQKARSLVSVVKIYSKKADLASRTEFKIWENDYLVEPFELGELFAISDVESAKAVQAKKSLLQQVHFTFKGGTQNIHKALELGRGVIHQVGLSEDDAVGMFAGFQEAVDNAHRHGNQYDTRKRIDVAFTVSRNRISLSVQDQGKGFDHGHFVKLAKAEDALTRVKRMKEEGRHGGLGIKLMLECSDKLTYVPPGNRVLLEKAVPARKAPAD
jgi:anti-anti-sigma factor